MLLPLGWPTSDSERSCQGGPHALSVRERMARFASSFCCFSSYLRSAAGPARRALSCAAGCDACDYTMHCSHHFKLLGFRLFLGQLRDTGLLSLLASLLGEVFSCLYVPVYCCNNQKLLQMNEQTRIPIYG